ncbi:uncharacterized protein LOC129359664 [Poeciliopsis prolifica]|uniref:uncharacterized protein LOC129359664 n=1 Tax=Poeciliopsis prolifica TaxID=188132 RepID=UPI00241365DB|nr:uncharacterized protein LOC129359664 [Poeciliopsis prolifica]
MTYCYVIDLRISEAIKTCISKPQISVVVLFSHVFQKINIPVSFGLGYLVTTVIRRTFKTFLPSITFEISSQDEDLDDFDAFLYNPSPAGEESDEDRLPFQEEWPDDFNSFLFNPSPAGEGLPSEERLSSSSEQQWNDDYDVIDAYLFRPSQPAKKTDDFSDEESGEWTDSSCESSSTQPVSPSSSMEIPIFDSSTSDSSEEIIWTPPPKKRAKTPAPSKRMEHRSRRETKVKSDRDGCR